MSAKSRNPGSQEGHGGATRPAPIPAASSACVVEVALSRPLLQTFRYRVPAPLVPAIRRGVRVRVPFGRDKLIGVVESVGDDGMSDDEKGGRDFTRKIMLFIRADVIPIEHPDTWKP